MSWTPFTRANHDRSGLRNASDTTDEEWKTIAPFMAGQPLRGRKRTTDLRAVIDALFYLLQSGCQWGPFPRDFPPESIVHHYFKRFSRDGTWVRIHDALYRRSRDLEGPEESPSYHIIDSQSVKTGTEALDCRARICTSWSRRLCRAARAARAGSVGVSAFGCRV